MKEQRSHRLRCPPLWGCAAALVVFATVAKGLIALLAGRIFKQSFFMCYAIVLNAFSGSPINMLITTEANNISAEAKASVLIFLPCNHTVTSYRLTHSVIGVSSCTLKMNCGSAIETSKKLKNNKNILPFENRGRFV